MKNSNQNPHQTSPSVHGGWLTVNVGHDPIITYSAMIAFLRRQLRISIILSVAALALPTHVNAAWLPWDRPIRRSIDASSKEVFYANVEKLRPDLDKEVYAHLVSSLAWLVYYHAAKLRLIGTKDADLAMRNMLKQVHKKSTYDIIMLAADLSEKETAVFAEYKMAQKRGKL